VPLADVIRGMSNADYHADTTAIGNSGISLMLQDPALYHGRVIRGVFKEKRKAHLDFGTAFHDLILAPGRLEDRMVLVPPAALAKDGSRRGKNFVAFAQQHPGKRLLTPKEPTYHMIDRLLDNEQAFPLIAANGEHEVAVFWDDPKFGVRRKCKFDKLVESVVESRYAVDLKTTTSVDGEDLSRAIVTFGYARQAVGYQDGMEAAFGTRFPFFFIFVQKTPPYSCQVVTLHEKFEALAREEINRGLARYKTCLESGRWVHPASASVLEIEPPQYSLRASEWETD